MLKIFKNPKPKINTKNEAKGKNHNSTRKKKTANQSPWRAPGYGHTGTVGLCLSTALGSGTKAASLIAVVTVARGSSLMKKIIHFSVPQHSFLQLSGPSILLNVRLAFLWILFPTMWSNWVCQVLVPYKLFFYDRNQTIAAKVSTFPNLPFVILIVKSFLWPPDCHVPKAVFNSALFPFVPPFHLTAISL